MQSASVRRLASVTVGAAVITAGLLTGAGPANAGTCTGPLCGVVYNYSASNSLLKVTSDWGSKAFKWISPGYNSKQAGITDADGFYIDSSCKGYLISGGKGTTTYPSGWTQIHDEEAPAIKYLC